MALFVNDYRAHNYSEDTIEWYRKRVRHFTEWLSTSKSDPATLADPTVGNFQLFILEKQGQGKYQHHPFHHTQEAKPSSAYIHSYFRVFQALGT